MKPNENIWITYNKYKCQITIRQTYFGSLDPVNVRAKFEVRSFTRSWDNRGYLKMLGSPWIRRSRSSKVVGFGTSRKRACDFLLARHSNLGPILHRFVGIADFCAPEWPHPYSTPISGVFPLHQIARVGVSPSWSPNKAIRLWNYFRSIPTCMKNIPQRHGQTDGRMDGRLTVA